MPDKKLVREIFDAHNRLIGVHQDTAGVTLDLGLTDRNLTWAAALELAVAIETAARAAYAAGDGRDDNG